MSQPIILDQSSVTGGEQPAVNTDRGTSALNNDDTLKRNSGRVSPGRSTGTGEAPKEGHDRSKWERRHAANLRITDTVLVFGAVILAHYVRFGGPATAPSYVNHYVTVYSAMLAIIWMSALAVFRTRSARYIGAGIEEYRRVTSASFGTFGAIAMAELLLKLQISRGYLAVALPAGVLGLVLSRWLWRVYVARKRAQGSYSTAVLAIGGRDAVANLTNELTDDPKNGYHVVGVCITGYGAPRGEHLTVNETNIPIAGGVTYTLRAIRDCAADTVAIAGTGDFGVQGLRRLIWELEPIGVDLMVSPDVMDVALNRLVMRPIAGSPLLHIDKPQYQGAKRFQRRAFDFCFAFAALAVSLPLLLVTAVLIKATTRGPAFYCSERIGIDGRPFSGLLFKIREDPRVTSLGRILRRFSIDELPQFINLLRQEMSVVGPRPPLRREVGAYDCDDQRRLLVKPGITGLWQVSGRSDLSWDKSVRLDVSYVDNWSMVGDIVIILKTLRAVFQRKGA